MQTHHPGFRFRLDANALIDGRADALLAAGILLGRDGEVYGEEVEKSL
ncbi:MAG TPA: hypothetical protein VFB14_26420 [Bryobacteraceae bacterium]|jgi:hypothetical protein|nr:hypothetical protein [Bryobacteraceae bacterium]